MSFIVLYRSHSKDSIISSAVYQGAKTGCEPTMAKTVPVQPIYSCVGGDMTLLKEHLVA